MAATTESLTLTVDQETKIRKRINRWFLYVKEEYEKECLRFAGAVAVNPTQAIENCGPFVKSQSVYEIMISLKDRLLVDGEEYTISMFVATAREFSEDMVDDMLRYHPWSPNSTCPASNLVRDIKATGRAAFLDQLRNLIREITKGDL